jgi:hypothetical protein
MWHLFMLKVEKAGSFGTVVISYQTTRRVIQVTVTFIRHFRFSRWWLWKLVTSVGCVTPCSFVDVYQSFVEDTLPQSSRQNSGFHTHYGEILKPHNSTNADDIWYMEKGIILKLLKDITFILYKFKKITIYNKLVYGIKKIWISLGPTNFT